MTYIMMLLIGAVAGLRAVIAPAPVSWAAYLGGINLEGGWAAFMGAPVTPWILTVLVTVELVSDHLPQTPSRKAPVQFGTRLLSGGFCGTIFGTLAGAPVARLILGAIGATIGTMGGYGARARLVRATGGRDLPIALLEDAVAITLAVWAVSAVA